MAFTRAQLRTKIGNMTGRANLPARSDDTKFNDVADDGIDAGLKEAIERHLWNEAIDLSETFTITSGLYQFSTSAKTFDDLIGATIAKTTTPQRTRPFHIKSPQWLNRRYPDRGRSGSNQKEPVFGAIIAGNLELQALSNDAYTITLLSEQPQTLAAAAGSINPIPLLDFALVAYGAFWVFESIGNLIERSDRSLRLFERLFSIARIKDMRQQAEWNFIERRGMTGIFHDGLPDFSYNLSDLQGLYP